MIGKHIEPLTFRNKHVPKQDDTSSQNEKTVHSVLSNMQPKTKPHHRTSSVSSTSSSIKVQVKVKV
jgi:hypothetical protein